MKLDIFLLLMLCIHDVSPSDFKDLDTMLKTIEVRKEKSYRLFQQPVSITINVPIQKYVYQLQYLCQSLSLISNYELLGDIPANIQAILRKKIRELGFQMDNLVLKIDKLLVKTWTHQFDRHTVWNHFTNNLDAR